VSVLVVGLSHKSAPVAMLERAAVSRDTLTKLLSDLACAEPVADVFVVSTCNRLEVYAEVDRFHAGVTAVCELLARHCGVPERELARHLYVYHQERAVSHLLAVACGLDSMVPGEEQILGQLRAVIKLAGQHGTIGRTLGDLGRVALRAGKRVRAETGITRAGTSLLSLAAELASPSLGGTGLADRDVLVVGAGAMSALAVTMAARHGAASIVVANRTRERAERIAAKSAVAATRVAELADLPAALTEADAVVCCTGAAGPVLTVDMIAEALASRPAARGPLVLLDLAMPRDVEPAVAGLPGVVVISMDTLREHPTAAAAADIAAAWAILQAELAAYRSATDATRVAPVVVALRAKAAGVVDAELTRLAGRLAGDGISGRTLDETARTVRRVVDKLLHAPTVRIKELAASSGAEQYAAALRDLFDLDPRAVEAVTGAAAVQRNPI